MGFVFGEAVQVITKGKKEGREESHLLDFFSLFRIFFLLFYPPGAAGEGGRIRRREGIIKREEIRRRGRE